MRVIATAGHVDHGKSTLVQALTGTDPDRLAEEKKRGLTIDLGFAGMALPDGEEIAFVDVPGHRRFIGNMLAGLGPTPVVMFVVAADQGWQAQSREHRDAVDALGLTAGILVVTRCDLASTERVESVREDALKELEATSLGRVRAVETDAVTGRGMRDLQVALQELVASLEPVKADADVRLWVDRSFTIKGTGTVVTGTLASGTIAVGDSLELAGKRVAVRSLQVLGKPVEAVGPVSRVAVGLRGVARSNAARGALLLTPRSSISTSVVDVARVGGLAWSQAAEHVSVHVGTAAVQARVRPLDEDYARVTFEEELPLRLGDRIIVRDDSASRIHCGAVILDIEPKPFFRRGAARRRVQELSGRTPSSAEDLLNDRGYLSAEWVRNVGAAFSVEPLSDLDAERIALVEGYYISPQQASGWVAALQELIDADAADPLSPGLVMTEISKKLGVPAVVTPHLVKFAGLTVQEGRVVGAGHGRHLGVAQGSFDAVIARLKAHPFDAPEADELDALGLGPREVAAAALRGSILRLPADPADIVLLPDAPARAMRSLAQLRQPFTTSEARKALETTRRVVIPLLEYLDGRGWTRREGNARYVVR